MKNLLLLAGLGLLSARVAHAQITPPADVDQAQQLKLLEARTGNTSFGVEKNGPARQFESGNKNGAFTVRKFRGMPGQEQKRGESNRRVMGGYAKGKPLEHKHKKKKRFLLF